MKQWILVALVLVSSVAAQPQPPMQLVWSDEFNGQANAAPDPAKWTYDLGNNNGWGNRELENYTKDPANAHMDGKGNLVIRAVPIKSDTPPAPGAPAYTSARIKTQGLFAAGPGGRVEARIKVPAGNGLWPAFWMLGNTFNNRNWPQCGEVDIMESIGREPSKNHGSLHGPGYSGGSALTRAYSAPAPLDSAFHVYALEWSASKITWELDGVVYSTVTPASIPGGSAWVFNHPFFIVLNLAVGGNYVGSPNSSTPFPQALQVDYVRVYRTSS